MKMRCRKENHKVARNSEIVALRARGATYADIARRFGILPERARQVVANETRRAAIS